MRNLEQLEEEAKIEALVEPKEEYKDDKRMIKKLDEYAKYGKVKMTPEDIAEKYPKWMLEAALKLKKQARVEALKEIKTDTRKEDWKFISDNWDKLTDSQRNILKLVGIEKK